MKKLTAAKVFKAIKHGNKKHQQWLRMKLNKLFKEFKK